MNYPYLCECGKSFEVTKSVKSIDDPAICTCGKQAVRLISPRIHFTNQKVEDAEYCPGVGQVVRNKAHRRQIAKDRGWEEVGNSCPDRWHDKVEKEREERSDYSKVL